MHCRKFKQDINLYKIAFVLYGISLIAFVVGSEEDSDSFPCEKLSLVTFSWNINLKESNYKINVNCYQFSLPPNTNRDRFLLELSQGSSQTNSTQYNKNLLFFLTKSKIQKSQLKIEFFFENNHNDRVIASDLDGFYTDQKFPKILYQEKVKDFNHQSGKGSTYYIYIYYSQFPFKFDHFQRNGKQTSALNYQLSLNINPLDTDLCHGQKTEQDLCKCFDPNKITLHCNVDVQYLSKSNFTIDSDNLRNNQVFLYLNHADLFDGISEEKQFKLEIKQIVKSQSDRIVVYDKYIDKQDFNNILPVSLFFKERMNNQLFQSDQQKSSFEYTIRKSSQDRIFYVYLIPKNSSIYVCLKEI